MHTLQTMHQIKHFMSCKCDKTFPVRGGWHATEKNVEQLWYCSYGSDFKHKHPHS